MTVFTSADLLNGLLDAPARPGFRLPLTWVTGVLLTAAALSYMYLDIPAAAYCRALDGTLMRGVCARAATFGEAQWYLVPALCVAVYAWRQRPLLAWRALYVFVAVAVTGLAVNVFKALAGRPRPHLYFSDGSYGFALFSAASEYLSFPSGHATTAVTASVAVALAFPKARVPALALGAFLAASRVITNAHYPADVLGGVWLGLMGAVLLWRLMGVPDDARDPAN